jgi:amphi-Trp domain-containing protein
MSETQLFKTEKVQSRDEIATTLRSAASQIESGTVELESPSQSETIQLPESSSFEVELERMTDSETGEEYYELEYELSWTK